MDDIESRLKKRRHFRNPTQIDSEIRHFEQAKYKLNAHAERLNSVWKKTGFTPHEILVAAARYRLANNGNVLALNADSYNGNNVTEVILQSLAESIEQYKASHLGLQERHGKDAKVCDHPWYGLDNVEIQSFDNAMVESELTTVENAVVELENALLEMPSESQPQSRSEIDTFLAEFGGLGDIDPAIRLDLLPKLYPDVVSKIHEELERFSSIRYDLVGIEGTVERETFSDENEILGMLEGIQGIKELCSPHVSLQELDLAGGMLRRLDESFSRSFPAMKIIEQSFSEKGNRFFRPNWLGITELRSLFSVLEDYESGFEIFFGTPLVSSKTEGLLTQLIQYQEDIEVNTSDFNELLSLPGIATESFRSDCKLRVWFTNDSKIELDEVHRKISSILPDLKIYDDNKKNLEGERNELLSKIDTLGLTFQRSLGNAVSQGSESSVVDLLMELDALGNTFSEEYKKIFDLRDQIVESSRSIPRFIPLENQKLLKTLHNKNLNYLHEQLELLIEVEQNSRVQFQLLSSAQCESRSYISLDGKDGGCIWFRKAAEQGHVILPVLDEDGVSELEVSKLISKLRIKNGIRVLNPKWHLAKRKAAKLLGLTLDESEKFSDILFFVLQYRATKRKLRENPQFDLMFPNLIPAILADTQILSSIITWYSEVITYTEEYRSAVVTITENVEYENFFGDIKSNLAYVGERVQNGLGIVSRLGEVVGLLETQRIEYESNSLFLDILTPIIDTKDFNYEQVKELSNWCRDLNNKDRIIVSTKDLISNNVQYKEALGENFKGYETESIYLLRANRWCRKIRQEYGEGFGPRVHIGDSITSLDKKSINEIIITARDYPNSQMDIDLQELTKISEVFNVEFSNGGNGTTLFGNDGLLSATFSQLRIAIEKCEKLWRRSEITIHNLSETGALMEKIWKGMQDYQSLDKVSDVFGIELDPINIEDGGEKSQIQIISDTLVLARYLNKSGDSLRNFFCSHSSKDKFREFESICHNIGSRTDNLDICHKQFVSKLGICESKWYGNAGMELVEMRKRLSHAMASRSLLSSWLNYNRASHVLLDLELSEIVAESENGNLDIDTLEMTLRGAVFDLLAREVLREDKELGIFVGDTHKSLQESFCQYDKNLKKLHAEKIAWKADKNYVESGIRGGRVSEHTDLVLLEAECAKQKRHIPIRQLVKRAHNALIGLKPCFMMGPMSVSQYLVPGDVEFDVVIMDEASQIRPHEALGSIARGRQLVIVGDPKQLPPTNFFERTIDGDSDEDTLVLEDTESILDSSMTMFPIRRLSWHYRSQHESLIAFSNFNFYDGELVLFPSPDKDRADYGISLNFVKNACCIKGKNIMEARAVAFAVKQLLMKNANRSVGVVAMNSGQRDLIENEIELISKTDSQFREKLILNLSAHEPLFVKNLENVQGDERDTVIISMTYGPLQPNERVLQRFGPINQELGWRRLNVLFTRSRKQMWIYSSMHSSDILVNPTSKRGVRCLRNFLEYCETGVLDTTIEDASSREPDSDFEIAVIQALETKGYQCMPQVGVAGYFIDVGVLDPNDTGRYLMGIECDGASYHSAKSARDRDRLRQSVLEGLGWRIRRIWSTDWFREPGAELEPIFTELDRLKAKSARARAEKKELNVLQNEAYQEIIPVTNIDRTQELEKQLLEFDNDVIRKELPNTPETKRILRPSLIKELIINMPTDHSEFHENIPAYLRQNTDAKEGKFIDSILAIIATESERHSERTE